MPFKIVRNDLTKVKADAIVNAANSSLLGGGGVDGAIHLAAGPELLAECRTLGGCEVGHAKITKGYRLPAKYVIHTVGPVWQGGMKQEESLLADCYRNSLALAKEYALKSVAFPLISSGAFGYPKDKALAVAISEISTFLLHNEMNVILVVYDRNAFQLSENLCSSVNEYIDDHYIASHRDIRRNRRNNSYRNLFKENELRYEVFESSTVAEPIRDLIKSLEGVIGQLDESFTQSLLRRIDEKGMTDSETYHKANISRKLFSKIRSNVYYKPSKPTVLAFAIALRLTLGETIDFLRTAGFALSPSSKFDIILQYFIEVGHYDIFEINEVLFYFDQRLLGI